MNVRELIEQLEEFLPDGIDGDEPGPEVRLAFQPSWPFQYNVGPIAQDNGHVHDPVQEDGFWFCDHEDCEAEFGGNPPPAPSVSEIEGDGIVYIAEAGQFYDAPYLPGSAREALGWS